MGTQGKGKPEPCAEPRSGVGLTHITYEDAEGNEDVRGKGSAQGNAIGSDGDPDAEPESPVVAASVGKRGSSER